MPSVPRSKAPHRSRWTSIVGSGLRLHLARRIGLLSNLDYWRRSSAALQVGQLRRLLARARGTEFGRSHDFGRLARLPDADLAGAYRRAVPIADWYAFKDRIARMREGAEPDVLWPGLIHDFAQTSGTTAGDKYIPVSSEMLRANYRASKEIFCHVARMGVPLSRVTGGRCLFMGGSTQLAVNDKGIRTGDLSGIVSPLIRWPITEIYSPGRRIATMSHWPSKLDAMAEATLDQDVRMVLGMPSWALLLFEKLVALGRARGRSTRCLRDVWPNLALFVHGGVKYAPFEPRVRQLWSGSADGEDVPNRLELYPASEAFVAIQDTAHDPGLRLLADFGTFFEFVPLERMGDPDPPAFACDAVEKGQRYVVALSTCAGLWRYVLGDVVEFDTVPGSLDGSRRGDGPCRLRIVGRHKHFINAFGENLIVEHIENAVAEAARAAGLLVGEFTAAPIYPREGRRAGLELAVEIECKRVRDNANDGRTTEGNGVDVFRAAFDESLKRQSVDYGVKRSSDLGMAPPTITALPVGTFHRWMESKGKLGGQHKCPRCANGREILESVIEFESPTRASTSGQGV